MSRPHLVAKDALEAGEGAGQLRQGGVGLARRHRLFAAQPPVLLLRRIQLLRQVAGGCA